VVVSCDLGFRQHDPCLRIERIEAHRFASILEGETGALPLFLLQAKPGALDVGIAGLGTQLDGKVGAG
jgi:hypothetical protein